MFPHKNCSWAMGVLAWMVAEVVLAQTPPLEPPPEDPDAPKVRMYTPEETIEFFQKKVQAAPKNPFLLTKLGQAYIFAARQTGDEDYYEKAETELLKVLELTPKSAGARSLLAAAYMAQHRFQEALKLSQELYRENPKYTAALASVGDAQLELGRYEEAEATFQELKQKTPGELPEVLARLSRIAELRGRTDEAVSLLKQALQQEEAKRPHSPELAWYHSILGELYFHSNQLEKADEHFQASLERREKYVPALLGLGQVRAAQGRYNEAAALYEQVVEQKPDFDLIGDLGTLYLLAGNKTKAKELEDKAISLIPVAAQIESEARHLALFLADREIQLDLALESAKKELKVREDIFAYDVLAWVLFKTGETKAAWEAMQKALRLGTKDARMHYHAGLIAKAMGQSEAAQEHLAKALEINPHFGFTEPQEAQKTLAELKAR